MNGDRIDITGSQIVNCNFCWVDLFVSVKINSLQNDSITCITNISLKWLASCLWWHFFNCI